MIPARLVMEKQAQVVSVVIQILGCVDKVLEWVLVLTIVKIIATKIPFEPFMMELMNVIVLSF